MKDIQNKITEEVGGCVIFLLKTTRSVDYSHNDHRTLFKTLDIIVEN